MKQLSTRGAARVGAVWMIVTIVLFFVALAYAYVANQAAQQARDDRQAAITAQGSAEAELETAILALGRLSVPVGFRDETIQSSASEIDQVEGAIESLKSAFGLGNSITTIEGTINPVITAYNTEQSKVQTHKGEIATLEGEVAESKAAARAIEDTLTSTHSTEITEKTDEIQVLNDRIATLEQNLANMTADRNSIHDDLNNEKGTTDGLTLQMAEAATEATNRMSQLNSQVEEVLARAETPDGSVLEVSKELGIGWIDRGASDRLSVGMVFDIMTGHPNPSGPAMKARCEVLRVEEKTSKVRIYDQADPYDPVVAADVIYNPIYDPDGTRNAVLVGRFGGTYNEAEVGLMLEEIGITVQKDLDLTTNYLIVGQPMYIDEQGEVLEEPLQPSDTTEYKNAEAQGCSIISIGDFRSYFKR